MVRINYAVIVSYVAMFVLAFFICVHLRISHGGSDHKRVHSSRHLEHTRWIGIGGAFVHNIGSRIIGGSLCLDSEEWNARR